MLHGCKGIYGQNVTLVHLASDEARFAAAMNNFTGNTKRPLGDRLEIVQSHIDRRLKAGSSFYVALCRAQRCNIYIGGCKAPEELACGVECDFGEITHEFESSR